MFGIFSAVPQTKMQQVTETSGECGRHGDASPITAEPLEMYLWVVIYKATKDNQELAISPAYILAPDPRLHIDSTNTEGR